LGSEKKKKKYLTRRKLCGIVKPEGGINQLPHKNKMKDWAMSSTDLQDYQDRQDSLLFEANPEDPREKAKGENPIERWDINLMRFVPNTTGL
jgi:hypothetical protein